MLIEVVDLLRGHRVVYTAFVGVYVFVKVRQVGLGTSRLRVFSHSLANFSSMLRVKFNFTLTNGSRSLLRADLNSHYRFLLSLFFIRLYATSLVITIGSAMGTMVLAMIYGMSQYRRASTISGVFPYFSPYDLYSFFRGERHYQ